MSKKRKNHSSEFKSKVALATIKDDRTVSELSQQYGINGDHELILPQGTALAGIE